MALDVAAAQFAVFPLEVEIAHHAPTPVASLGSMREIRVPHEEVGFSPAALTLGELFVKLPNLDNGRRVMGICRRFNAHRTEDQL